MADEIKVTHEQLEIIKRAFFEQARAIFDLKHRMQRTFKDLVTNGWQGRSATHFKQEMEDVVLPAVTRLGEALTQAGVTTGEISQMFQQAEKEAAAPWQEANTRAAATTAILPIVTSGTTPPLTAQPAVTGEDQVNTPSLKPLLNTTHGGTGFLIAIPTAYFEAKHNLGDINNHRYGSQFFPLPLDVSKTGDGFLFNVEDNQNLIANYRMKNAPFVPCVVKGIGTEEALSFAQFICNETPGGNSLKPEQLLGPYVFGAMGYPLDIFNKDGIVSGLRKDLVSRNWRGMPTSQIAQVAGRFQNQTSQIAELGNHSQAISPQPPMALGQGQSNS